MNLFDTIKDRVPVRDAAERYGIQVSRNGMCKCPFHQDNDPSMKFYNKRFHCFGCTADGDVIDFTSRLFNISLTDAAKKLSVDFGISYDQSFTHSVNPKHHEISEADKLKHQVNYCYKQISDGAFFLCFDGLVLPELEKVLREAMDDVGGTINWWLYESGDKKTVTWEKNGISHSADLTDIDALYDYLVEAAAERHQEQQSDQQLPGQISL